MRLAERVHWGLTPNALSTAHARLVARGETLIDLTITNPTQCGLSRVGPEALQQLTRPQIAVYAPQAQGALEARQAVADYYQRQGGKISPEQIFLTSSTSEGYAYLFRLLLNPGEKVLFPRPSYPLFHYLSDLNDVVAEYYSLKYEGQWRIDFDQLEAQVTQTTRAMVLVSPNNPTGSYLSEKELARLKEIAQRHELLLIGDEVFRDYPIEGVPGPSLIQDQAKVSVVLNGLSKILALPQMKLSWMIINGPSAETQIFKDRLEMIADTYLSVNTPVQWALSAWLAQVDAFQHGIKRRIKKNQQFLEAQGAEDRVWECLHVEGGWVATIRLPDILTEEEWALKLLEQEHVYAYPGYFYDFCAGRHLVLSLLPEPPAFQEGVRRITQLIQRQAQVGF